MSRPDCVAKAGVMVIVPAVDPACKPIWVAPVGKTASVLLAGIVNETVRPPVANCTEGSGANAAELMAITSCPVSGKEYGAASDRPIKGCCSGVTVPLAPVN